MFFFSYHITLRKYNLFYGQPLTSALYLLQSFIFNTLDLLPVTDLPEGLVDWSLGR